jgi:hypothetical protein
MTKRTKAEIDRMLEATAAEYADEEREAANDESRSAAASSVFSVRLPPATYEAVRDAAARVHLTPSALIRQWVTERIDEPADSDLVTAIDGLRRDVERLAKLAKSA